MCAESCCAAQAASNIVPQHIRHSERKLTLGQPNMPPPQAPVLAADAFTSPSSTRTIAMACIGALPSAFPTATAVQQPLPVRLRSTCMLCPHIRHAVAGTVLFVAFVAWKMRRAVTYGCCGRHDTAAAKRHAVLTCAALLYKSSTSERSTYQTAWQRRLLSSPLLIARAVEVATANGARSIEAAAAGARAAQSQNCNEGGAHNAASALITTGLPSASLQHRAA